MDVQVVKTENGNRFNQFGEQIVDCRLCSRATTMSGTKLCDRCWELERQIKSSTELVRRILKQLDGEDEGEDE